MRYTALACCLLLAACDSGSIETAEAQAVHIRPSSNNNLIFNREYGGYIETVYANSSGRIVFFAVPSPSTALDRWEDGAWVEQPYWYGTLASVPRPAPVGPGEYHPLTTLSLFDAGVLPGRYRIRADVYEDAAWKRALPESERVSLPFEVVD